MADTITLDDLEREFEDYTRLVIRLAEERKEAKKDAIRRRQKIGLLAATWIEKRASYTRLELIVEAFVNDHSSKLDNSEVLSLLAIADEKRFVEEAFGEDFEPKPGDYQTWFQEVGRRYSVMRDHVASALGR